MQETQEIWVQSLGQEDPLEREIATHSSILAWEIPWTEEPGRLQHIESQSQTLMEATSHRNLMETFDTILTLLEGINQYCKPLIL